MKIPFGQNRSAQKRICQALVCVSLTWMMSTSANAIEPVVKMVVPATAGGPLDAMARLLAPELSRELQQPVVVENRPGAGGTIGIESVVRAVPDGKTLLMAPAALASNVSLYKLNFDPVTDLKPVIQLIGTESFLLANERLGVKTIEELRLWAQGHEKGVSCAAGPGSMTMGCELLRSKLMGRSVTVSYPGVAQAVTALLGGHVDVAVLDRSALGPVVGNQSVRILASTGASQPLPPFERLPLLKNTWPDWSNSGFFGIFVPAGSASELVEQLNRAFNKALAQPHVVAFVAQNGDRLVGGRPEVMAAELVTKIAFYKNLVQITGSTR